MTAAIPAAWAELIEGLGILAQHPSDPVSPFHCEHDVLRVMADASEFSTEEIDRLDALGFHLDSDGFYSFKYGSA